VYAELLHGLSLPSGLTPLRIGATVRRGFLKRKWAKSIIYNDINYLIDLNLPGIF
jgi:hypothetical protein